MLKAVSERILNTARWRRQRSCVCCSGEVVATDSAYGMGTPKTAAENMTALRAAYAITRDTNRIFYIPASTYEQNVDAYEMYVEGVSTRKVREVTEALCATSFSKSLVSSLASQLDAELEGWRSRSLEANAYLYLFVDARYEEVRVGSQMVSEGMLLVAAVREDGYREILAVDVADVEGEATYTELFRSLKRRGLKGVELVTSGNHEGLKAAVGCHSHGTSCQRCQAYHARNLLRMVSHGRRKELAEGLRMVFAAPTRELAIAVAGRMADRGLESHPKVAEHIEEYLEDCLTCLSLPESHRRHIRTTSGLEGLNQETKRRTRVVRIFPNRKACCAW